MAECIDELRMECQRLEDDCNYTSVAMFIWLKWLRGISLGFHVLPLIFGSIAGWNLLKQLDLPILVATCSFFAGLFPVIYKAVGMEKSIATVKKVGADFRNLRDDFRRLKNVSSLGDYDTFAKEFGHFHVLLKNARQENVTIPEFVFEKARRKISEGHMTYDIDDASK
jgi:hypothetical protein